MKKENNLKIKQLALFSLVLSDVFVMSLTGFFVGYSLYYFFNVNILVSLLTGILGFILGIIRVIFRAKKFISSDKKK